jgi:hypothetical protein
VTNRHISAKRAFARVSERAEHGEKFGFIAAFQLLVRSGVLTREQVAQFMNDARITRDDLERFRKHVEATG